MSTSHAGYIRDGMQQDANEIQDYEIGLVGLGDCEGAIRGCDTCILMNCDIDGMYERRLVFDHHEIPRLGLG